MVPRRISAYDNPAKMYTQTSAAPPRNAIAGKGRIFPAGLRRCSFLTRPKRALHATPAARANTRAAHTQLHATSVSIPDLSNAPKSPLAKRNRIAPPMFIAPSRAALTIQPAIGEDAVI